MNAIDKMLLTFGAVSAALLVMWWIELIIDDVRLGNPLFPRISLGIGLSGFVALLGLLVVHFTS